MWILYNDYSLEDVPNTETDQATLEQKTSMTTADIGNSTNLSMDRTSSGSTEDKSDHGNRSSEEEQDDEDEDEDEKNNTVDDLADEEEMRVCTK